MSLLNPKFGCLCSLINAPFTHANLYGRMHGLYRLFGSQYNSKLNQNITKML
jgi:hypothetical protein